MAPVRRKLGGDPKPSTSKRTANLCDDSKPSTSKRTAKLGEDPKPSTSKSTAKLCDDSKPSTSKRKAKLDDDPKPSTSKSTANSEENISPNRQTSKKVKPGAMQEENSSGDEPSPPKAVKKSPPKPAKKDMKKSPSYFEKPKKIQKLIEERRKMENNVEEIEFDEYPPFCCNSIRPQTDQEAIFNQFMEKRGSTDRIFEVIRRESNGRKFISMKYFDLHDGIRTKIPPNKPDLMSVVWRSKITILKADCELHNLSFELNSLQKRMTGPWKIEAGPRVDYTDYSPKPNPNPK